MKTLASLGVFGCIAFIIRTYVVDTSTIFAALGLIWGLITFYAVGAATQENF